MNYRHIYHAGNFADVMKHLVLCLALDHFKKKEAGFCVIDAHGGLGLYDLSSIEAQKTNEYKAGIGRFDEASGMPPDFALYYDLIRPFYQKNAYPGSPLLCAQMLRGQDRLIANELHPQDYETLAHNLRGFKNARVTHLDAYELIRANLPPREKRGIVLIDPPFEKTDEFEKLIRQMQEWKKRFATGCFILWYPVKAHLNVDAMLGAAKTLGLPRTWYCETLLHPRGQESTFNGCGFVLFNAPYQIPERMEALLPFMARKLGLHSHPHGWLTAE
ncbi:MAG: 23S rRNA (adenine(2030)-N(6))-methyltransferase RlmJ [Micavibrio sp.]